MKKIVVISDTHGYKSHLEFLKEVYDDADVIVHLGDTSSDGLTLSGLYPTKTHVLNGNCDFMKFGQDEEIFEVEGVKIFACHGHLFSVKSARIRLAERAKAAGCDIALYGHTHCAREENIDGVTLFNPGAWSRSSKSYLYLTVDGKSFKGEIVKF